MATRRITPFEGPRKDGPLQVLVTYDPVNLAEVVNDLSGTNVKPNESREIETIDEKLVQKGLPVYVEHGWLSFTRKEAELPPWLRYRGQKKVRGVKQEVTLLPPAVDIRLRSKVMSHLMDAQRIGSKEPTLTGGAFVYQQIMEAYVLAAKAGIDLFHHPSLWEEARSPVNWFIRGAFARARTYFAKSPDFPGLMHQLLVPSAMGYMFGAEPTKDFHAEFVPIFEEAARTAKREAKMLLQERTYTTEALKPISDVANAAEAFGVRVSIQFR